MVRIPFENQNHKWIRLYNMIDKYNETQIIAWGKYRYYKSFPIDNLELILEIVKSITRHRIFISVWGKDRKKSFHIGYFSLFFPENIIQFKDCKRLFKIKLKKRILNNVKK